MQSPEKIRELTQLRDKIEQKIDAAVDIKNLREQLIKIREYIDEENKGIENLTKKRSQVESEADEVRGIIGNFTEMISGIDGMVNKEKEKVTQFKRSLENQDST